jgi:hypothetical protein
MGLLESLDQTFGGPETQAQYALLRQQQIKAQAMADEQAKQRAAGTAQARLLGTMDPATGATLQAPRPRPRETSLPRATHLWAANPPRPLSSNRYLGPADMNGQRGLLSGGPQDMRQSLMNQADPDTAMARAQMQSNPLFSGLPQDQRAAAMFAPKEFGAQLAKSAVPDPPPDVLAIRSAQAIVDKLGPNNPAAQPYLDLIKQKSGALAAAALAETNRHNLAEEGKPISGGMSGSFLQRNPATGKWELSSPSTSAPMRH